MWNSTKSVVLSRVATWTIIVLALLLAALLPFLYQAGIFPGRMAVPEAMAQQWSGNDATATRESFGAMLGQMGMVLNAEGTSVEAAYAIWLLPLYYAFLIPALIILITLDRMLQAIQKGEVFTSSNVKRLRLISWGCFAAALILALGVIPGANFCLVLAILAVFFGIILRIVKNLFAAAVELKDENDYTI